MIRELKLNHGFKQYAIIQNEGIVIKCEGMEPSKAVQVAYLVLDLCSKSKKYIRELFDPPDNDVEVRSCFFIHLILQTHTTVCLSQGANNQTKPMQSLRLKTAEYEMIVAQLGNYTLVVVQDTEERPEEGGEEEDGEGKADE